MDLLTRRRLMMQPIGGDDPGRLPPGYKEVQYIEAPTGRYSDVPYIRTDMHGTADADMIRCKFQGLENLGTTSGFYGNTRIGSNSGFTMARSNSGEIIFGSGWGNKSSGVPFSLDEIYEFEHATSYATVNGVTISISAGVSYPNKMIQIFGVSDYSYGKPARCFYFQLYKGGNLVRDYVPCYRESDNIAGMYELITNTFLPSNSVVNFVAGPKI